MSRNLWQCEARSRSGSRFGDYLWADTKSDAILEFERLHGVIPHIVKRVRREW
jgi:hypothetical protein